MISSNSYSNSSSNNIDNNTSNNNFTFKDTSSDIAPHLPSYMREPLTILSRIRGYKGIDDYVIHMDQEELVSIKTNLI